MPSCQFYWLSYDDLAVELLKFKGKGFVMKGAIVFVFFVFFVGFLPLQAQIVDSLEQEFIAHESLLVLIKDQKVFRVYENGILVRQGSLVSMRLGCPSLGSMSLKHKWSLDCDDFGCWMKLSYAKDLEIKVSESEAKWLYSWLDTAKTTIKVFATDIVASK